MRPKTAAQYRAQTEGLVEAVNQKIKELDCITSLQFNYLLGQVVVVVDNYKEAKYDFNKILVYLATATGMPQEHIERTYQWELQGSTKNHRYRARFKSLEGSPFANDGATLVVTAYETVKGSLKSPVVRV